MQHSGGSKKPWKTVVQASAAAADLCTALNVCHWHCYNAREQSATHLCPRATAPVTQQLDAEASSMCRFFMCFINIHISLPEVTSDECRCTWMMYLYCVSVWVFFCVVHAWHVCGKSWLDAVFLNSFMRCEGPVSCDATTTPQGAFD